MSITNKLLQGYYTINTLFGTRKKVDKINNNNILKARNSEKEITILLHGVGATYYGAMYGMIKWFTRKGICIVSVGYEDGDKIKKSAEVVKNKIDEVMKKAHVKKVNLLGISLGGLVARYYTEKLNGSKNINKLITVYTPFQKVKKKCGILLNKLVGGNPSDSNLAVEEIENNFSVKNHLAIYGKRDGIIGRQYPSSKLPKYIKQEGVEGGHTLVSFNIDAMKVALKYLED